MVCIVCHFLVLIEKLVLSIRPVYFLISNCKPIKIVFITLATQPDFTPPGDWKFCYEIEIDKKGYLIIRSAMPE